MTRPARLVIGKEQIYFRGGSRAPGGSADPPISETNANILTILFLVNVCPNPLSLNPGLICPRIYTNFEKGMKTRA